MQMRSPSSIKCQQDGVVVAVPDAQAGMTKSAASRCTVVVVATGGADAAGDGSHAALSGAPSGHTRL